jgi:hypothetical protein
MESWSERMTTSFGHQDRSPAIRRFLPLILVCLLIVLVVASLVVRVDVAARFASRARAAQGMVIAREPNNHASVRVRYEVDGVTYEVADSFIGPPNPDFDTVRVGDNVAVYFDPEAPSRAVLAEPTVRESGASGFALVTALILATLFAGALAASLPLWTGLLRRRG